MSENRCPNCDLLNLPGAETCLQCKTSLTQPFNATAENVPRQTAQSNEPIHTSSQQQETPSFAGSQLQSIPQNNPTGRRTYFWYRVYCSLMTIIYIVLLIFGILGIFAAFDETGQEQQDILIGSLIFILPGIIFGLMYLIGVVLPAKPYSWIYGIALIGLGMTSCVFIPLMIPLLIFWMKPETQAFFERK